MGNKYKQEHKEIDHRFKKFYRQNKIRQIKKKQKLQIKLERNGNKLISESYNKHWIHSENDKKIISKLYELINKESFSCNNPLSGNYSKSLLQEMKACDVQTKHCGFLYFEQFAKHKKKKKENDEHKTMRMDIDDEDHDEDEQQIKKNQNQYFCHNKL